MAVNRYLYKSKRYQKFLRLRSTNFLKVVTNLYKSKRYASKNCSINRKQLFLDMRYVKGIEESPFSYYRINGIDNINNHLSSYNE